MSAGRARTTGEGAGGSAGAGMNRRRAVLKCAASGGVFLRTYYRGHSVVVASRSCFTARYGYCPIGPDGPVNHVR